MEEQFTIDNDKTADWAICQIHEAEEERDRLITLAQSQIDDLNKRIEDLKARCESDTAYLKSMLAMYFNTVKSKETKTQKTYKLISGTLVYKKPAVRINHDDEKLIELLNETEYVETKKVLKWGDYKKNLISVGNDVIDSTTGEIVEACSIEEVPASFSIKY